MISSARLQSTIFLNCLLVERDVHKYNFASISITRITVDTLSPRNLIKLHEN